jgi:hypothetical protein
VQSPAGSGTTFFRRGGRGDERYAADAPLTRLREAPGTKCARGQSADSDLDKQSETPTGQAVSRPGLARA